MASSKTRLEIVQIAVAQAGRGAELYAHAKSLLNAMLRSWAFESQYKQLRKTGAEIALAAGSSTCDLPDDFGYGMENLLFGTEKLPLDEKDPDEFVRLGGFPGSSVSPGRPSFYMIDHEANVIRFNITADQAYSVFPIYYKVPADISTDSAGDNSTLWFDDDDTIIQGLVERIYQFKEDEREFIQEGKVERKKGSFKRGIATRSGGSSGVKLASSWFKSRRH